MKKSTKAAPAHSTLDCPAPFANRFEWRVFHPMVRISLIEQSPDGEQRTRAAAIISVDLAKELAESMLKGLQPREPEAAPDSSVPDVSRPGIKGV